MVEQASNTLGDVQKAVHQKKSSHAVTVVQAEHNHHLVPASLAHANRPSPWSPPAMAMDDESSVEQRCARIRGRMVWILSQLEGDGSALTDLSDAKLNASPGGARADQLRAQQEAHEREMDEELERQASRLQAEHAAELDELRARLTATHANELAAMRAEVAAAKEAARKAQSTGQTATRDAKLEAERQRGSIEAAHRAELAEARKRVAALEACLCETGPLLSQVSSALPPAAASEFGRRLATAQRSFDVLMPGSAPSAPPGSAVAVSPAQMPKPAHVAPPPKPVSTPATGKPPPPVPPKPTSTTPSLPAKPPPPAPPKPSPYGGRQSLDAPAPAPPPSRPAPPSKPPVAVPSKPSPAPAPPKPPPPAPPKPPATPAKVPLPTPSKPTPKAAATPAPKSGGGPGKQPPPQGPCLVPCDFGYTHPGGSKPLDAKNQDTFFTLTIDDHNAVFGVLDGHGGQNGTLVAQVAADAIKAYLAEHFNRLRTEPEAVFTTAFEKAHELSRQVRWRWRALPWQYTHRCAAASASSPSIECVRTGHPIVPTGGDADRQQPQARRWRPGGRVGGRGR